MNSIFDTDADKIKELYNNLTGNELDTDQITCDVCSKTISMPFYCYNQYDCNILYTCESCINDIWNKFQILDRTNNTIEEKPLIWPCLFCKEKQGGGKKWYNLSDLDVCLKCFEQKPSLLTFFNQYTSDKKYLINDRDIIIDITPTNWSIPESLKSEITFTRVGIYIDILNDDDIASLDNNFGSYCEWVLFTDIYSIPHYDAATGLLVNINSDESKNGKVASIVYDNHGRVAIDIIYQNLDEYWTEYYNWLNKNYDRQSYNIKVKNDLESHWSCDNEDMALACEEFSGYIRNHLKLSMYYG